MVDFKVAVEILAAGNIAEFLSGMSRQLTGIHAQVKDVERSIGAWKALAGGAALAFGGVEVLKFIDHLGKAGGEMQRQANNFQAAGNSIGDTARAVSAAFDSIQKVPGVDAVDAMKRYRELAGATQDNAGSIGVLPDFLKAQVVYGAAAGEGADAEDGMKRIAKMIELRQGAIDHLTHKIDPKKFDSELDVAVKALQVGQGLITANDLQQLIKQAGPMAKGMDPLKFWSIYLASLEEMGGARTGTAMTAVARQVLGGIMTPRVANEWRDLGMLDPQHHGWHVTKKGDTIIDDPKKAIRGYQTFNEEGFQSFVDKFVRPAMVNAGYVTDKDQNAELYKFGSTETARRLYSMYLTGSEQVEAEQRKIQGAKGISAYDEIYKGGDYQQGIDSLTASIKSLEEALGGPAGKAIGAIATEIAEQINKLAQIAHDHPEIVAIGTYATSAAAGLAVLAGAILAVSAALKIGGWALGLGSKVAPAVAGEAAATTAATTGAEGWFARLMRFGTSSASLPALIDAVTDPNLRSDQAKANDEYVIGKLKSWWFGTTPPAPPMPPPVPPVSPAPPMATIPKPVVPQFTIPAAPPSFPPPPMPVLPRFAVPAPPPMPAPPTAAPVLRITPVVPQHEVRPSPKPVSPPPPISVETPAFPAPRPLPGLPAPLVLPPTPVVPRPATAPLAPPVGVAPAAGALPLSIPHAFALPKPNFDVIGGDVQRALDKIPGVVRPAIDTSFAAISTALTSAIASLAASAQAVTQSMRALAAAVPAGGTGTRQPIHVALHADGRELTKIVTYHQLRETRTASSTGRYDGSMDPTPVDYGFT